MEFVDYGEELRICQIISSKEGPKTPTDNKKWDFSGQFFVNTNKIPLTTPMFPSPTARSPKAPDGIMPKVQNIVSTFDVDAFLNLKEISLKAANVEYRPNKFAAVIMRIREPKTTALIFSSGKIVCTGAKSESESKIACRKYARIIKKLGFETKFDGFKIENLVGSGTVNFKIKLQTLQSDHSHFASYEPELFPGLIYRMIQPKVVLLIFTSGKVIITGCKTKDQMEEAFDNIYYILLNHKVK